MSREANIHEYKIDCMAGEGNTLGTALRKYIIAGCVSWRPVGFKFNNSSANSVIIADNILQSCIKFRAAFSSLKFEIDDSIADGDFCAVHYSFNTSLSSDDLSVGGVRCLTPGVPLLQATDDATISFIAYFRKGSGTYSESENYVFLQEKLNTTDRLSFSVTSSAHYLTRNVTFDVETYDTKDVIIMKFSDTEMGAELIKEAAKIMIERLQTLI